MTQQNPTYASIEIPTVAAAVDGLLRLESETAAKAFLANIAEHHIVAREQLPSASKGTSLTLWIRGYDIRDEEDKAGALGNMAVLALKRVGTRWSIAATKLVLPPSKHPQRKYISRGQHPNWGQPLMKAIQKGKFYQALSEAEADLATLHEAYPNASIPTKARLYIMVYSRDAGGKGSPITKYVFEPKALEDGRFTIDVRLNTGVSKKNKKPEVTPASTSAAEAKEKTTPKGKFTAREQIKRTRRKPKA
jgi:hypothetical protein